MASANHHDVTAIVRQLAEVAQQLANRDLGHQPDPVGEVFKKIAQSKPPVYHGESDPVALENWLREFDKLFEAIGCEDGLRVNNATFYLRGEADLWWSQYGENLRALPAFGWEAFKERIRDKFYSVFLQKQKADEFLELKMGNMSVTEYYSKFLELSRFAREAVATERMKASRFERGLPLDIQMQLTGQVFETLDEIYGRAAHLYTLSQKKKELARESEVKRKEASGSIGHNYNNHDNHKKPRSNNFNNRPNNTNNYRGPGSGNNNFGGNRNLNEKGQTRTYRCRKCSNNHPGKDCEGRAVTCHFCNKLGHREFECFTKARRRRLNMDSFIKTSRVVSQEDTRGTQTMKELRKPTVIEMLEAIAMDSS